MPRVWMYCTRICPYCQMADRLLRRKGVEAEKVQVDDMPQRREEMMQITGRRTVPQIFIGDSHVGGFQELAALDRAGALNQLLQGAGDRPGPLA